MARLRVRLPDAPRADGRRWATTSRSSRRMLAAGPGDVRGPYAQVRGAINEPKGLQQPRIPIIVGGNGRNVTIRYAARFADELNLVFAGLRRGPRADSRRPAALRGDRPGSRDAPGLALLRATPRSRPRARNGSTSSARSRPRARPAVAFPTRYGADRGGPGRLRRGLPAAGLLAGADRPCDGSLGPVARLPEPSQRRIPEPRPANEQVQGHGPVAPRVHRRGRSPPP